MSRLFAVPFLAAAVFAAPAALAQTTPVVTGAVTEASARRFVDLIADGADAYPVQLDITAAASDGDLFVTGSDDGRSVLINAAGREGPIQVMAPARRQGDTWTVRGLFLVEYVSMNQGIMAYYLKPAEGAATRPVPVDLDAE